MSLRISQTAHYVPPKVITNDDLAEIMTTSDEWISSRTGIKKRHVVQDEQTSDLALTVAQQLLQKADLKPEQLDFIIVATMSPDYLTPSTAAIVQGNCTLAKHWHLILMQLVLVLFMLWQLQINC